MRKDKCVNAMMMVCLVLFVLGTFFDEPVEWFMVEHGSQVIANVTAAVGPLPPYVLLAICFAYLSREKKLCGIVSLVFSFVAGWSLFHLFVHGIVLVLCAAVSGIVLYCLSAWLAGKLETSAENRKKVIAVIVALACARVIVEVMKVLAGRPRFVFLEETGTSFSPWYAGGQPHLLDDRFKSFPSGHAMSASLLYIWACLDKEKKWKALVSVGFAIVVSLGRMMCGMHYLSDVAMGMFIGYCSVYLFEKMLK